MILKKSTLSYRKPSLHDGAKLWELVRKAGTLDINSAYAYFILADHFKDTCLLAKADGQIKGFVTGYRKPNAQQTLFVWQIGVDPEFWGMGVAKELLAGLVRENSDCRTIHTTISPGNKASEALFRSFARDFGYTVETAGFLNSTDFPTNNHEDEILFKLEKK